MTEKTIRIWDLPTRLFHWCLVLSVSYAWFAVEILEDMQQHFYAGYCTLTLLLFRVVWGFVGTRYARFKSFFFKPGVVFDYAKKLFSASSKDGSSQYLGHNPLGSLSALAMLAALLFQASSGLFSSDDYFHGPLSGLIESSLVSQISGLHLFNVDVITVLVVLHVLAIAFYQLRKKEKLINAMITGKKVSNAPQEQGITSSKLWLAAIVVLVCAGLVYYLANAFLDLLPVDDYLGY